MDQSGLEAVRREFILTKPEVDAFVEKGSLIVTNNFTLLAGKPPEFCLIIMDYSTPDRAAIERDYWRGQVVEGGRKKKHDEADLQRIARSRIKTSGRYLVMERNEDVDRGRLCLGMEWLQKHYQLD